MGEIVWPSQRELQMLDCLARGMTYKQIAAEMFVSHSTVRTHLHNVYGKLDVVDRAQAVLVAIDRADDCPTTALSGCASSGGVSERRISVNLSAPVQ